MKYVPDGYVTASQIYSTDTRKGLLPVSQATWRVGVKKGRFPPPDTSLGERMAIWRRSDIEALMPKIDVTQALMDKPKARVNSILRAAELELL